MAGNAGHSGGGVDGRLPKEVQAQLGFLVISTSNVLWIVWGWHDQAYALIALQVCLAVLNIRGVKKNEPPG